jgi:hypothetical protein
MRTLLRKMTDLVDRITGPGATLNAMGELDRAASSVMDVDAQLRRVCAAAASNDTTTSSQAA